MAMCTGFAQHTAAVLRIDGVDENGKHAIHKLGRDHLLLCEHKQNCANVALNLHSQETHTEKRERERERERERNQSGE